MSPVKKRFVLLTSKPVIRMLNMEDFAEAVVGVPGEGLNVEQRKLLTIGVELAAKPALLLFLDEPTSGLDSQSSWTIVSFLRKLADSGQAVLSTIHQPSSVLFQQFDRLLFLAKGGRVVYFGDIGQNSRTLLDYFERQGARKCEEHENPAEYILELAGAGASGQSTLDWPALWRGSPEAEQVERDLGSLHETLKNEKTPDQASSGTHDTEFAMPFWTQLTAVMIRVFQQYWRTPSYIYGKFILGIASARKSWLTRRIVTKKANWVYHSLRRFLVLHSGDIDARPTVSRFRHLHDHRYLCCPGAADHAPVHFSARPV
jgi:ATP-binding cassette subfamily G (WHITE) protein 2 (PDR)